MKIRSFAFILILILSFFLRIYKFNQVPPGLNWDEAALGFNAYSILKTARDEYGTFLPLSFRSFNDYKAPLFIYFLIPFIKVFGRTTFALRFPSALFGTLTVLLTYFLTKEILKKSHYSLLITHYLPIIAALLLAISPWHLQFSRPAFEANAALFLTVLGVFLILRGLKRDWFFSCLGTSFLALSLWTYHSNKIFVPLLFLSLVVLFKKKFFKDKKKFFLNLMIFSLISLPVFLIIFKNGSRLQSAGIFGRFSTIEEIGKLRKEDGEKTWGLVRLLHNRPVVLSKIILGKYCQHFSPDFLFLGIKTNWRVSLPMQGQLYLFEAPFFLFGIYYLLLNLKEKTNRLILFWLFLSPLPASIGQLTPHALRMLLVLPMPQIITGLGLVKFLGRVSKYKVFKRVFVYGLLVFSFLFFISFYFYNYYVYFPYESGFDWQEGHKEMVEFIKEQEEDVEKVIVTDYYMQPYIFFLWFGKIEPKVYQEEGLKLYEFRPVDWLNDRQRENVLLVGTAEEIPENEKIIKEIRFTNGKIAFRIVQT